MVETSFQGTPEWYGGKTGILKDLVERAEAQSRQRYEPYEKNGRPLPRISPFTPLQKTGFNLAEQEATNPLYSRLYGQAAQNIGGAAGARVAPEIEPYLRQGTEAVQPYNDVQNYMNPYQDQVVNQIATLGNRNLQENVLPRVNQQFIGAGQYGATGHQNLMNRALRDNQEAISQAQGQALHGGYNTALQTSLAAQTGQRERALGAGELSGRTMGRDIERQLAGGEALSSLANQQQQAGLRGAATIGQLGAQQQQQGQNELNTAYQQFQEERAFPQQQVGRLNEIIRGLPVNTSGYSQGITPQAPQPSPWRQGAGIVSSLYGATQMNPQGFATGGHVKQATKHFRHYADGGNITPIQQGANHAIDTAELQELRGHAQRLNKPSVDPFWASVSRAGAHLAGSQNPNALGALGQSIDAGLNEYHGIQGKQDERQLQSAKIMEMIDTTKRLQAERNRTHQMKQQDFAEKQRQFGLSHDIEKQKLGLMREKETRKNKERLDSFASPYGGGEYAKMKLKEEAKSDVKRAEDVRTKASLAHSDIHRIDEILSNIDKAKLGPGFEGRKWISSAAQTLGIDTPELGDPKSMLEVKKGLRTFAMDMVKGMSTRPTNFDLETAIAALPDTIDSPEAVKQVLSTMKKFKQIPIEESDFKDRWETDFGSIRSKAPNGMTYDKAFRQYTNKNWSSKEKKI